MSKKITRENGWVFIDGVIPYNDEDADIEIWEAYNITKNILGYGDDMRDWSHNKDVWGEMEDLQKIIDDGTYSIVISEDQFSEEELSEILE